MEGLLSVILNFTEILTGVWSNLYNADTLGWSHRCPLYTSFNAVKICDNLTSFQINIVSIDNLK